MKWTGSNGGGDFEPAPAGTHIARCIRLIDLGTQTGEYEGRVTVRRQVLITWELSQELMTTGDHAGQPFTVNKFYTQSLHEKATLRHDLEAWRGRAFTDEELAGFDARNILGAPCLISVVHTDKGKAKVQSVMALPKGTNPPKQVNESILFSLEPEEYDAAVFDGLSDYWKAMIQTTPEFAALGRPQAKVSTPTTAAADDEAFDDDSIPF